MQWVVFALVVLGSSAWSSNVWERRYRRRWQHVELPSLPVGTGAYRHGHATGAVMTAAPLALRAAALSCTVFGRGVTAALLATAAFLAGAPLRGIGEATMHALLGYLAAAFGVGALAAMGLAAMWLGVGNDLLLRNHRSGYRRARAVALASLALHGFVWLNVTLHGPMVVHVPPASLAHARTLAGFAFVHAAMLLALARAHRAGLDARTPSERRLDG